MKEDIEIIITNDEDTDFRCYKLSEELEKEFIALFEEKEE